MFVGRERERAWLDGHLRRLDSGLGGLAVVSGPPGIGKTRVVREAVQGREVVWSRGWELGEAPALWPITQVLRAVRARDPEVFEPHQRVLAPLMGTAKSSAGVGMFAVANALSDGIVAAAERRPLCVVFDDLHAADLSTLEVLALVEPAWRLAPVLVIATLRTVDMRCGRDALRVLARIRQSADERELRGLASEEVADLVHHRVGVAPTQEVLDELVARAGGVPLYVEELANDVVTGRIRVPRTLEAALAERLDAFGEEAREVLCRAALLRQSLSPELIARSLGCPISRAETALIEAAAEGLVARVGEGWHWTHQLHAEAIVATQAPDAVRSGHLALADALADLPDHSGARAEHAVAGGHPDGPGLLCAAAVHAESTYGFATAARLYGRAAGLIDAPLMRARVLVARARALVRSGDRVGAHETVETAYRSAVGKAGDGSRPGESALVDVAKALSDFAEFGLTNARAEQVLAEALDVVTEGDEVTREDLVARQLVLRFYRDPALAEDRLLADAEAAGRFAEPSVALRLHVASMMLWRADRLAVRALHVVAMEALAPQLQDPRDRFVVARWAFNTALERCDGEAARRAFAQLEQLAGALGTPREAFVVALRRATLLQLEGRSDEVDVDAIEASGRLAGDPHTRFFRYACGGLRAVVRGDRAAVLEATPVIVEATSKDWSQFPGVAFQGVWMQLHAGDLEAAESTYRTWRDTQFIRPPWWGTLQAYAVCADVAMALEDREGAEWLLERMADYPEGYAGCGPTLPFGPLALAETRLLRWLGRLDEARHSEARARRLCARLGSSPPDLLAPRVSTPAASPVPTAEIQASGDVWLFRHGSSETRHRAAKGWIYIATLIERDGQPVHVLELASGDRRGEVEGDAGPVLDARAREAYSERVRSLYADLAEAEDHNDLGRTEGLHAEIDALMTELAAATGLGGRDRRVASNAERARMAVKQAIRRALARLATTQPDLAEHLQRSIETGMVCRYRRDPTGLQVVIRRRP